MTTTMLADVIRRQTAGAVVATVIRITEQVAEQMAEELLRDPEFKEEMKILIGKAFRETLKALHEPPTTGGTQ